MTSRFLNTCPLLQCVVFHAIFLLSARSIITFGFTNETDQQALLAIKNQIPGDPSNFLSSWNNSLHFCSWSGVTCSRRHQRVTMLDLSSLNLFGSLSPQIGNLTFLKVIYLHNNSFHGGIPREIGQLHRLQRLILYNNNLQGNIPTNLSHCSEMRMFYLYGNNLGGNIPTELGSLSKLQSLKLSKNDLSGPIPTSFGNLSTIRILDLATNNLVGSIPTRLSQLSQLEYINLGRNTLFGMVPLPIYNISSLQVLGLTDNQIHGKLPPDLGLNLPNLIGLLVGMNNFSGSFPLSIANASKLVRFDISINSFTGPLPMNLGSLHNVEGLNLDSNLLGTSHSDELSFLVKSLINCTNLQDLDISNNGFRGELPYFIVNLSTTLTYLVMGSNNIYGSIPQEIGNLGSLVTLGLNEIMLRGSIPKTVGKLSKLEGLYVYTANISGEIPTSIGNLSRLAILALQENMLEGNIPISLGNLTNVLEFDLSKNRLTGVIPGQIIGISSIINLLNLDTNQLTGAIPSNLGSLKNLDQLSLSGNRLTGEIPSTLGNCLMLEFLYLSDNFFQGTIPSSFKQLKSIQIMDLSHNNLSGKIPSFLGEFKLFQKLNISHNMLEGEVPTEGVFKNVSMFSVVGNLQLCGGIQALQLPPCRVKDLEKRTKSFPHRIIPLVIILPIVILLVCLSLILYRLRRSKEQNPSTALLQEQHPKISYKELFQATNGFSLTNLVGEGRYGSVYKGILNSSEQVVAVKVLNVELRGANTSFLAECEAFRNIRHRNLVKIITSCSSIDFKGNDFKALVLEFMPKGSLDSWLHPSPTEQQNKKKLTLLQSLNIAIDVASAVDYLHHHCHTRIIHCDLKPSNILLNEDFAAHVSDFGLARFLSDTSNETNRPQTSSIGMIRGTTGYVPPEYGMGGEVSSKGDVYSYGILLLEMFTGKRPTNAMFTDSLSLRNHVSMALPQKVMEIIDPQIIMESEDESNGAQSNISTINISKMEVFLTSVFQIGIFCCAERPRDRTDIKDALSELIVAKKLLFGMGKERDRDYY